MIRRCVIGGELGGKSKVEQTISGCLMILIWVGYVVASSINIMNIANSEE